MQEFFNAEILAALKHFQTETIQNEFNDQLYASQFTEFANRNVRADHMK